VRTVHSWTECKIYCQGQFPYECATSSTTEEHNLHVFEIWVLRKIFWCKIEEVVGGWRKFYEPINATYLDLPPVQEMLCITAYGILEHFTLTDLHRTIKGESLP